MFVGFKNTLRQLSWSSIFSIAERCGGPPKLRAEAAATSWAFRRTAWSKGGLGDEKKSGSYGVAPGFVCGQRIGARGQRTARGDRSRSRQSLDSGCDHY